jgi:hypothetical protein
MRHLFASTTPYEWLAITVRIEHVADHSATPVDARRLALWPTGHGAVATRPSTVATKANDGASGKSGASPMSVPTASPASAVARHHTFVLHRGRSGGKQLDGVAAIPDRGHRGLHPRLQ